MTDLLFFSHLKVDLCRKVAAAMGNKFGKALGYNSTHADLATQIHARANFKKKKEKRQMASSAIPAPETHEPHQEIRSFSKRQCYALEPERDLPSEYPSGETSKTQADKKAKMFEMSESGEIDWRKVKTLMQETYVSQRATVNSLINFEGILEQWPFFGKVRIPLLFYVWYLSGTLLECFLTEFPFT